MLALNFNMNWKIAVAVFGYLTRNCEEISLIEHAPGCPLSFYQSHLQDYRHYKCPHTSLLL